MKRFLIYLMLAAVLSACLLPVAAVETSDPSESTGVVREPGWCGEAISWEYEDGVLTIRGQGRMDDFPDGPPWQQYREEITTVVFEGSVTYIGAGAFTDYDALEAVDFGNALVEIGAKAFASCDGLTAISLPANFKIFGEESFRGCRNLTEIHCAGGFPKFRLNCLWDSWVTIYYPAERPWPLNHIADLEKAFQGRIEFISSDGEDHYQPTEPTEETTEPTEETTEPTEETTEPTEETTEETTEPTEEITEPSEETTQPTYETEPATQQTQLPTMDTLPDEPEEEPEEPGGWIGIAIIGVVFCFLALGMVVFGGKRGGGKYAA